MIDLEALLAPIGDESPTGENLRYRAGDTTFEDLEESRREVDPEEDPSGDGQDSDWAAIVRTASGALAEESKDLELATRLTEALVHRDGFAGLAEGLELCHALIERFWDQLHPGYDPEDGEIVGPIRARPLGWLVTALASGTTGSLAGAKLVPLVPVPGERSLTWQDYENGQRLDEYQMQSDQSRYQEMVDAGMVTSERWNAALASAPPEALREVRDALVVSEEKIAALETLCDERFGDDAPILIPLRDLVNEIREFLDKQVGSGEEAEEGEAEGGAVESLGGARVASGPIANRAQAIDRLREIAEFFRRTEPHSPMAALIGRAVKWGSLSFEDLVRDYIKDPTTQGQIWELLGIEAPEE